MSLRFIISLTAFSSLFFLCWQCLCEWWFPEALGLFYPCSKQFQKNSSCPHQFQQKLTDWLLLDYLRCPSLNHWLWAGKCNAWIGQILVTWSHLVLGLKHCPIHNEWEFRGRGCYSKRRGVKAQATPAFHTFEWGLPLTEAQPQGWNSIACMDDSFLLTMQLWC